MEKNHPDVDQYEKSIRQLQAQRANATGEARVNLTHEIDNHKKDLQNLKTELGITRSKKHSGFA